MANEYPEPTYAEAFKDRTKEVLGKLVKRTKTEGMTGKAAKEVSGRRRQIDKAVDGYRDGGCVKPNGKYR